MIENEGQAAEMTDTEANNAGHLYGDQKGYNGRQYNQN